MSKYRLLALDLDGTLLNDNSEVTEETKRSIKRAVDKGFYVVFATGRDIKSAEKFWRELDLRNPAVFLNGGEIWKAPGRRWKRNFIEEEDMSRLYQLALEHDMRYVGFNEEEIANESNWPKNMLEKRWMKFWLGSHDIHALNKLKDIIDSWGTVEVTQSAIHNMEITGKGITKQSGMEAVCELLGIRLDQVIAVGDSMNDYYLIKNAGLGIAMGNAVAEIKAVADDITDTNEREGVAKVIDHYILNEQTAGILLKDSFVQLN